MELTSLSTDANDANAVSSGRDDACANAPKTPKCVKTVQYGCPAEPRIYLARKGPRVT
eukprot:CAMPEP_0204353964 /NCGR_PEP_ID=MMETSP0469-20131031/33056_1 /ASSEMBLY_ACC=CAM_ASM_000384 /TAXON_ID=2969 /ORGANISM="Oxyrrhis marina" /LENGTH=57 /DNA_ID=CAMNT_0051340963 /DNA_START=142 /DNA_END=312 /DNA_ORIENTATION=+